MTRDQLIIAELEQIHAAVLRGASDVELLTIYDVFADLLKRCDHVQM